MKTPLLAAAGLLLVGGALFDLAWTTLASGSGAGPLSGRLSHRAWALSRRIARWRDSAVVLATSGALIIIVIFLAWITLVGLGWWLVFMSSEGAVLSTQTSEPAGTVGRLYFTGYTILTLGNGEYIPGGDVWQMATVLTTGSGLGLVTLSISYIVPLASAVGERRALAGYISALGEDGEDLVVRAWDGEGFGPLTQHLVALATLLETARQRHFTYPMIHYFWSDQPATSMSTSLTALAHALELLRTGVDARVRPHPAALEVADRALRAFLDTLAAAYIRPADAPIPRPSLERLHAAGIPVEVEAYEAAAEETADQRRLLGGFLVDQRRPS